MANETPPRRYTFPTSYDVWQWPEFIALRNRLGIPAVPDRTLIIRFEMDGEVFVDHEYLGQDTSKQPQRTIEQMKAIWGQAERAFSRKRKKQPEATE